MDKKKLLTIIGLALALGVVFGAVMAKFIFAHESADIAASDLTGSVSHFSFAFNGNLQMLLIVAALVCFCVVLIVRN